MQNTYLILPDALLMAAVVVAWLNDLFFGQEGRKTTYGIAVLSSLIAGRLKRSAPARRRVARASALTYIGLGVLAALSGERSAPATR